MPSVQTKKIGLWSCVKQVNLSLARERLEPWLVIVGGDAVVEFCPVRYKGSW